MTILDEQYAAMTKAERDAPATRGDLMQFIALMLKHMKALNQRIKELEKGAHS
ncbi:hypothetical protein I6J77_11195 [Rhodanobacter sp. FDAARGOS 1247]|uniref:hypothetical protein n=1 Tax=Rhodanobacter sp. FDAARGOS 1247 TaxID=2778082 RepID=UPI00194E5FA9|nr:hypothetical protein [Rhodanobacter sp. FDAARGOS 1247]QRP62703.1 hypothetical protein I6J77_11195 [Rhodanobacter sp. FDAARGOS 1247]